MSGLSEHAETITFEDHIDSTPEAVRDLLGRIGDILGRTGWGEMPCGVVELVLAEVLNNIVEHAYREQPGGSIGLTMRGNAEALDITLRDKGTPMPGLALPEGAPVDIDVATEDLPEGGFGWYLIRSLVHHLAYSHADGVNRLELSILRDDASDGKG